jgi:cob(I)alamin adenosyltransferase
MYTKGGDKGETGLLSSRRVPKDSPRVEAYGSVDELNSAIGVAVSISEHEDFSRKLRKIQELLFVAGADLAADSDSTSKVANFRRIGAQDTSKVESEIRQVFSELPRLKSFILPGGSRLSAQLHVSRAICRRAERRILTASKTENINPELLPFFNRLSTYLFNLARAANQKEGVPDEVWSGT